MTSLAGQVTWQSYPASRTISPTYDTAGRLSGLSGILGDGVGRTYTADTAYTASGQMQEERFGTNTPLYHKLHYNTRGQLYDIRLSTVGWATDSLNWNRGCLAMYYDSAYHWGGAGGLDSGPDNNGNVTKTQHWIPNSDYSGGFSIDDVFTYDELNRVTLTSEWNLGSQQFAQGYSYDRWGNRTINAGATWGAINNKSFTVNSANALIGGPTAHRILRKALEGESDPCVVACIRASLTAFGNKRRPHHISDETRTKWYTTFLCNGD